MDLLLATHDDLLALEATLRGEIAAAEARSLAEIRLGRGVLMKSGERYGPDTPSTTTLALVANRMYFCRLQVSVAGSINEARIRVTTPAASSVIRLGIYRYVDGTLLADWGTVDGAAAADERALTIAMPTEVEPQTYLLCAVAEGGGPTITAVGGANIGPQAGVLTTLQSGLHRAALTTTGSLPSTVTVGSLTGTNAPRILVRAA